MSSRQKQLTPNMASKLLSSSIVNRHIRQGDVRKYVADIVTGNWLAPTIILTDRQGNLMDGHHRCHAVIQADKSIPVIVVEGDKRMMHGLDQGIQRNLSDILTIEGFSYTRDLQGAINQSCITVRFAKTGKFKSHVAAIEQNRMLTNREKLEIFDNHLDLQEHVAVVKQLSKDATVSSSRGIASTCRSVAATYDAVEEYDAFLTSVYHGEGLRRGEPEYQLRQRLLIAKNKGSALNSTGKYGLWVKAWNLSYAGEEVNGLRHSPVQMPFGAEEWAANDNLA